MNNITIYNQESEHFSPLGLQAAPLDFRITIDGEFDDWTDKPFS